MKFRSRVNHFNGQAVEITKNTFTLKGDATFVMKYELHTKKKPASIEFTMTESPFDAGATASGILQLKAGELSICYAPMGGEPPSQFDAKEGSGHFLSTLKRSDK